MSEMGKLVVSLEANIAKFTSDMGKASQQTEQAMGRIGSAISSVKGALAALGVGASVGGFAMLIKGAIDAADNLRDMSQKTGVAVETLNGLGFAAGQAGGNLESIVAAAGKLNKSIVEAAGGNKDTGEAFAKLGISVRDATGQLKTADVVMAEVADKFKGYADGPEKTAIALRIFSKAGADMIPMLNDGGTALRDNIAYAKQYSGVTQDMADAADNFNDTLGKLAIQQKSFGNAMAGAVLPLLQRVSEEMLSSAENSNKFALASVAVRTVLETFIIVGSEVAFTFKAVGTEIGGIAAQLTLLAQGKFKEAGMLANMMKADAEEARKVHDKFIADILNRTPEPQAAAVAAEPPKPRAPALRANGDDPTKALMDGRLKAIEASYAAERDTASYHDKYMQALRDQDIIDLRTYEAYKEAARDNAAANARRAYDAELAVLSKARASAAKESERATIDNKIKEVSAEKEKALRDAQQARALATLDLTAAQSELNKVAREWTIQQDQAAAQFQFEISLYGKSAVEAAKLTAARRIYLDVEERIRQAQKNSANPIDRTAFNAERDKAIAASNALYDQADGKLRDPWFNMTESVRRYREEASNTGLMIGNAMTNAFQSAEDAFVDFVKTGKLSFSSLANSILADLARIAAKKAIAGFVDMAVGGVGSLFGPGTIGGGLGGARASGGPVSGGVPYLVGERGPEIFTPSSSGQIIPNHAIGGGGGIQINTNVSVSSGGTTSQTSGDSNSTGRALAGMVNAAVKDVLVRESRQGGLLWNQRMGRA